VTPSPLPSRRPTAIVTFDDVLADPRRLADVAEDALPAMQAEVSTRLIQLAAVQAAIAARQTAVTAGRNDDRLLDVDEAAVVLSQTTDWVYRHAKELPFTVRVGTLVRFSAHGIQTFIRNRRGRS